MSLEQQSTIPSVTDADAPSENRFIHLLEREKRLSESLLWEAQRKYFERNGIDAWRTGVVPHYVTNNPHLAASYAEVVLGYLRDCHVVPGLINPSEPVYIIELGSGSGRFGFFFLKALTEILGRSQLAHIPFRYVMTDLTESNLEFHRAHSALQPFLAQDKLDFALFDLESDGEIRLERSGKVLTSGSLVNPLIVIANYVFDSVKQDAFLIQDSQLFEQLVSVYSDEPRIDLGAADVFDHLALTHTSAPAPSDYYSETGFNAILQRYTASLKGTVLLFPVGAIRCMERLADLSSTGFLLLSADKGEATEEFLDGGTEARFVMHGSFSLPVNYHAIKEYWLSKGGCAFTYSHGYTSLNISAFGLDRRQGTLPETELAYDRAVGAGAVDDLLLLQRRFREHPEELEAAHLLALIRLSGWDPAVMQELLPVLSGRVESLLPRQRADLFHSVRKIWENYFHIGEQRDLAFNLGSLLFQMDEYEAALWFFNESCRLYGEDWPTVWNQGLCYCGLQKPAEAAERFSHAMKAQADLKVAAGIQAKNPVPKAI